MTQFCRALAADAELMGLEATSDTVDGASINWLNGTSSVPVAASQA
jgi:hypothetical protein